jgi:hypothetical protein
VSIGYIWWYGIHDIATCGGLFVHHVHIFHTVLPALQPVAAGMKQGEQIQVQFRVGKVCVYSWGHQRTPVSNYTNSVMSNFTRCCDLRGEEY